MAVEDRIKKVIVEHIGQAGDVLDDGANIKDDLGADSLDIVELDMAFEDEFDITIGQDDGITERMTVAEIVRHISARVK